MSEEIKRPLRRKRRYMTGEDIDMFREKVRETDSSNQESICDKVIDGA